MDKKPYAITEYAGWFVAGRKVPGRRDEDGNFVPMIGHVLQLTDAEAKYELLNRSIEPVKEEPAPPAKPMRGASKAVEGKEAKVG